MGDAFEGILFSLGSAEQVAHDAYYHSNGGSYTVAAPRLYGAPSYIEGMVQHHLARQPVIPPKAVVCRLKDALVRHPGFIFVGNKIVRESLLNLIGNDSIPNWMPVVEEQPGRFRAKPGYFTCTDFVEETTVCMVQNGDVNYGHWIIECLPRLSLVAEHFDLSKLKFLVSDYGSALREFQIESLSLYGIKLEQIIPLVARPMIFRDLIYPAPLTVQPYVKAPIVLRNLRDLAVRVSRDHAEHASERLYVSRNKWGTRSLVNEPEIVQHLSGLGFDVVRPEELSVSEQIVAFSNAKVVVGPLGGSLSNLVFCPDGVDLVALTTLLMNDDFFWDIISQKGGEYHSIHGAATDHELGMQSDFNIDMEIFRGVLDGVLKNNGSLAAARE